MLLSRPSPQTTDSLPSYLLRLTAANGYNNPIQLLRSDSYKLLNNRLPGKKIFFGEFNLERVALLANINRSQVEELRLKQVNKTRCLALGQAFLNRNLNFSHVRICPECYQECHTIPLVNSLMAKSFCTKHNCPLVCIHPQTNHTLTWGTHFLWRDAANWHNKSVIIEVCEAEFSINQQIESIQQCDLIVGRQALCLADYCDLLTFFAHFHQFAFSRIDMVSARNNVDFCRQYYTPAYWYIKEWPTRFFELLEHFEYHPMSDRRLTGIRKCFRDLYDEIYSPENNCSSAYELLKSGFEEYLRDHFANGMLMRSLTQIAPHTKNNSILISDTQVSDILGSPLSKVKVYVREKLLSPSHTLPNGTRLFFRYDVLKLKCKLQNCCSLDECSNLLGISIYRTRQLLRAGIISPLIEPSADNRDWLVEKQQVKKLVNKLKASVDHTVKKSSTAKKRYAFAKVDFDHLIKGMLNGDIKYGYTACKAHPLSLEQFTSAFEPEEVPCSLFFSPKEAAKELEVNINAIYDFIKLGYLECKKLGVKRTPRPVKMIPKASIDRFKFCYRLTKQITDNVNNMNMKLISGPKIDGSCVKVYSIKH
jgi:DNA-binding transcriptional MerR regulator